MTDYVTGRAGAREDFCRYLAACYYEPSSDFAEERLFDSMVAAASAIDPALTDSARRLGAAFSAAEVQELLVDYARLFIGPAQPVAMPYASFWLTADQWQRHEATMAVLDFYEEGGFEVSDELRELPDHVAVELEFLYLLTFTQNQARDEGDAEELSASTALRRRFVHQHVGAWIDQFTAAVNAGAGTAFYKELAELTRRFIRIEAELDRAN